MKKIRLAAATLALFVSFSTSASVSAINNSVFGEIGAEAGVDPVLLYAVALTESAYGTGSGVVKPNALALRVADQPGQYPATLADAKAQLSDYLSQGYRSIDIGLMQINTRWHGDRVDNIEDLLIPAINIKVGAQILKEAMASHSDRYVGIGRYYTYSDNSASSRYGERVIHFYNRLKRIP